MRFMEYVKRIENGKIELTFNSLYEILFQCTHGTAEDDLSFNSLYEIQN